MKFLERDFSHTLEERRLREGPLKQCGRICKSPSMENCFHEGNLEIEKSMVQAWHWERLFFLSREVSKTFAIAWIQSKATMGLWWRIACKYLIVRFARNNPCFLMPGVIQWVTKKNYKKKRKIPSSQYSETLRTEELVQMWLSTWRCCEFNPVIKKT